MLDHPVSPALFLLLLVFCLFCFSPNGAECEKQQQQQQPFLWITRRGGNGFVAFVSPLLHLCRPFAGDALPDHRARTFFIQSSRSPWRYRTGNLRSNALLVANRVFGSYILLVRGCRRDGDYDDSVEDAGGGRLEPGQERGLQHWFLFTWRFFQASS